MTNKVLYNKIIEECLIIFKRALVILFDVNFSRINVLGVEVKSMMILKFHNYVLLQKMYYNGLIRKYILLLKFYNTGIRKEKKKKKTWFIFLVFSFS